MAKPFLVIQLPDNGVSPEEYDRLEAVRSARSAEAMQNIYPRLPLDTGQFRLLSIQETDDHDHLTCSLQVAQLGSSKKEVDYVALSYTWGKQPFHFQVTCNGQVLPVTRSCRDALEMLRKQGCLRVWIDQICIDQSNLAEKAQQVALMGDIYRGARLVYAWLGQQGSEEFMWPENFKHSKPGEMIMVGADDVDASVDLSFRFWSKIFFFRLAQGSAIDIVTLAKYDMTKTVNLMQHLGEVGKVRGTVKNTSLLADEWAWIGMLDIFARTYFLRRWTLQEHALARDVRIAIGEHILEWSTVEGAVLITCGEATRVLRLDLPIPKVCREFLVENHNEFEEVFSVMGLRARAGTRTVETSPLLELLRGYRLLQVKDPRDRIYSFLSLATEAKRLPAPDYTRSAAATFKDYVVALFRLGQGPTITRFAGRSRQEQELVDVQDEEKALHEISQLPTWCPKFLMDPSATLFPLSWLHIGDAEELPNPSAETKFEFQFSENDTRLTLKGSIIDEVAAIQHQKSGLVSTVEECLAFVQFVNKHTTREWINDQGIRTVVSYFSNCASDAILASLAQMTKYNKLEMVLQFLQAPLDECDLGEHLNEFAEGLVPFVESTLIKETVAQARDLCATASGCIGVSSHDARPGDKIAVIHGVPMLLILRQSGSGVYEIVGDAFVQGLMEGEALQLQTYHPTNIALL